MIAWNKSLFYNHVNGDCVAAYSEVSQYVVEKYFTFNAKCVTSKEFAEEFSETYAMLYYLLYNGLSSPIAAYHTWETGK